MITFFTIIIALLTVALTVTTRQLLDTRTELLRAEDILRQYVARLDHLSTHPSTRKKRNT